MFGNGILQNTKENLKFNYYSLILTVFLVQEVI